MYKLPIFYYSEIEHLEVLFQYLILILLFRSELGKKSVSYSGVVEWNKLPTDIQCVFNIKNFKRKVKISFLNKLIEDRNDSFIYY